MVLKLELGDTNVSFESFYTQISSLVDQHLPQIRLTNKQKKFLSKPWITAGLRKSIYKRDKLFRHFTKASDRILKSNYRKECKTYRNYIVSLSRKSKSNYHSNYFHNHINNIQKIWQGGKNIISTNSSSKSPVSLSVHDNISFDPTLFSNTFNDYFCTIADTIRANIPHSTKHFSRFLKQSGSSLGSFLLIQYLLLKWKNVSTRSQIIRQIATSMPTKILKLLQSDICYPLQKLINMSFKTGLFPNILKISKVTPVFKKGNPLDVANYRPISLLSNFEKILEKLLYSRIFSFLEHKKTIYLRQFGFRKGYSTSHTLACIIEGIQRSIDDGQFACGNFIDLQKAFDTVDHEILLCKLNY